MLVIDEEMDNESTGDYEAFRNHTLVYAQGRLAQSQGYDFSGMSVEDQQALRRWLDYQEKVMRETNQQRR